MANTARLVIDPITRKISTKYEKIRLVKNDNNSMRITFEMPRYVRGHDMSKCSTAEVHYDNISIDRKQKHSDVYVVTDIVVAPEDDQTINFSWLVSRAATQIVGNVDFSIYFGCNEDPDLEYAWHTTTYSGIVVLEGKHNTQSVVERYPDLVASILEYVDKKVSEVDFDEMDIAQETGNSVTAVMSQKAVTDVLDGKVDVTRVGATPTENAIPQYGVGGVLKVGNPQAAEDATPRQFVEYGLLGKVDALTKNGMHVYTTENGVQRTRQLVTNPSDYNVPIYGSGGTLVTNAPQKDLDCTNMKYVNDGLSGRVEKTTKALKVYGTKGLDSNGNVIHDVYDVYFIPTVAGSILQATNPTNSNFDIKHPTMTAAVCDPQKPTQIANMRYVDDRITPILGTSYEIKTVESTENPVSVPVNVLPEATIDKIGTGIKVVEAERTTIAPITTGLNNVTYNANSNTIHVTGDSMITIPIETMIVRDKSNVSWTFTVAGGGFSVDCFSVILLDNHGLPVCEPLEIDSYEEGATWTGQHLESLQDGTEITHIVVNSDNVPYCHFDPFGFRVTITGCSETVYNCVPVTSVQQNGETIYTVPEAIRNLTGGQSDMGVYGLALDATVYNYLDLENKVYVVRCAYGTDENNGVAIVPYTDEIDVSAYLTDEDGEITVAAGDEILFVAADGTSAGDTVPSGITYCMKKGG